MMSVKKDKFLVAELVISSSLSYRSDIISGLHPLGVGNLPASIFLMLSEF